MDLTYAIEWSRESLRMALILGDRSWRRRLLVGLLIGIAQTLTSCTSRWSPWFRGSWRWAWSCS